MIDSFTISAGAALAAAVFTWKGPLRRSGLWLALAMLGQGAALRLIDAGNKLIHFQHFRPERLLQEPALLVLLTTQAVLVAWGLKGRWSPLRAWLSANFNGWKLLGLALVFFLPSATVSRQVSFYVVEFLLACFLQTVNLANFLLVAFDLPPGVLRRLADRMNAWLGPTGDGETVPRRGIDRFALCAALWITVAAAALSFFVYEAHPHVADEVVYLYHARYLAKGMLTMPLPPAPAAFNIDLMMYGPTRWYCPVPPGWPAVLALGVLAGVPWLVNPVLGGLGALLCYMLLGSLYGRRSARIGILLLCVSPWYLYMNMSFMTHPLTLVCAAAGAIAVVRAKAAQKAWWALAAGVAAGIVSLIRPLDGLIVAALLGLWIVASGGRRFRLASAAAFVIGAGAAGALTLPYNKALTGSPARFPLIAYSEKYYWPGSNDYGFGPNRGMGWPTDPYPGHGPLDALINTNLNVTNLNFELFGWSTGSLFFIGLFLFGARMRDSDYLMLSVIAAVYIAHFFYWFSGGSDFGPRYWYLMLVPCLALSVRGIQFLESAIGRVSPPNGVRVLAGVFALCAVAAVNFLPWRAMDKYHHYLRMRPDVRRLAKEHHFGRSLILIRGDRFPDYASAAIYNPIDLRAPVPVYAWDKTPEIRKQVLAAYPDRPVWILEGPTLTGGGFRIVAGPRPASELLGRPE